MIFSKLDLFHAYHQVHVEPSDVPKTTVATPFWLLFEFPCMPFGLWNAAQTFQCFMDEVLQGPHFCYGYRDDLLIVSSNPEELKQHLQLVFEQLQDHSVVISPAKCELGVSQLQFSEHQTDS